MARNDYIKVGCYKVIFKRERHGGLVVQRRTPDREVGVGSSLGSPCCILEQDTFTSQKVVEAVALSRHDGKIVDWDVKPQQQTNKNI